VKLYNRLPLALLLFSAATVAHAATVNFNLTSALLSAQRGQTVTFSGTISNVGPAAAFLNGDAFTFSLPVDDTLFFLNVPQSLAPGASVTAPLFTVSVPAAAALGLYVGTFSVLGGDTVASQSVLATRDFGVQVVPEPGVGILWVGGLISILLYRRVISI
jgi:hypothetical protein